MTGTKADASSMPRPLKRSRHVLWECRFEIGLIIAWVALVIWVVLSFRSN
jgi:hypothetical protein